MYLERATSKRAAKLEERVVVFGADDMGFGLDGSERLHRCKVATVVDRETARKRGYR